MVLLAAAGTLLVTAMGPARARYELSPAGIAFRGDIYGRRLIPPPTCAARRRGSWTSSGTRSSRHDGARLGTGLPGYSAGWFRLKNGEKSLVSLTDRHRAVYVPTSRGYALLVSPAEPDSFLAALRRVAPAS